MSGIAIVAALERELAPFVRNWKSVYFSHSGREFRAYEHESLVAIAGGIGRHAAEIAAKAIMAQYKPQMLISAGLAGALLHSLKVGSVITPNVVVDAATGKEYRSEVGGGVLVTADEIANTQSKATLVEKFHALAVDMEAAAVAEFAQQNGIAFRCVKAISDEADFVMPPLNQFVDETGSFQNGKFAAWAAFRPLQWPKVISLARNSSRASVALRDWLKRNINNNLLERVAQ